MLALLALVSLPLQALTPTFDREIAGRLVEVGTGQPVAGHLVRLERSGVLLDEVRTGPEGRYRFPHAALGMDLRVRPAWAPGLRPEPTFGLSPSGDGELRLVRVEDRILEGVVVQYPDGAPLPRLRFEVSEEDGPREKVIADAGGAFRTEVAFDPDRVQFRLAVGGGPPLRPGIGKGEDGRLSLWFDLGRKLVLEPRGFEADWATLDAHFYPRDLDPSLIGAPRGFEPLALWYQEAPPLAPEAIESCLVHRNGDRAWVRVPPRLEEKAGEGLLLCLTQRDRLRAGWLELPPIEGWDGEVFPVEAEAQGGLRILSPERSPWVRIRSGAVRGTLIPPEGSPWEPRDVSLGRSRWSRSQAWRPLAPGPWRLEAKLPDGRPWEASFLVEPDQVVEFPALGVDPGPPVFFRVEVAGADVPLEYGIPAFSVAARLIHPEGTVRGFGTRSELFGFRDRHPIHHVRRGGRVVLEGGIEDPLDGIYRIEVDVQGRRFEAEIPPGEPFVVQLPPPDHRVRAVDAETGREIEVSSLSFRETWRGNGVGSLPVESDGRVTGAGWGFSGKSWWIDVPGYARAYGDGSSFEFTERQRRAELRLKRGWATRISLLWPGPIDARLAGRPITLRHGWNLVELPVRPENPRLELEAPWLESEQLGVGGLFDPDQPWIEIRPRR